MQPPVNVERFRNLIDICAEQLLVRRYVCQRLERFFLFVIPVEHVLRYRTRLRFVLYDLLRPVRDSEVIVDEIAQMIVVGKRKLFDE
ncbi:hypothetical protein D3C81_1780340 [compost metagenome]